MGYGNCLNLRNNVRYWILISSETFFSCKESKIGSQKLGQKMVPSQENQNFFSGSSSSIEFPEEQGTRRWRRRQRQRRRRRQWRRRRLIQFVSTTANTTREPETTNCLNMELVNMALITSGIRMKMFKQSLLQFLVKTRHRIANLPKGIFPVSTRLDKCQIMRVPM